MNKTRRKNINPYKRLGTFFIIISLLPVFMAFGLSVGMMVDSQARSFTKPELLLIAAPGLYFLLTGIGLNRRKAWGFLMAFAFLCLVLVHSIWILISNEGEVGLFWWVLPVLLVLMLLYLLGLQRIEKNLKS